MEDFDVLVAVVFILAAVVVFQYCKIKSIEILLRDFDNQKSWAEFDAEEAQNGLDFQERVIKEFLKEFSEKELTFIQKKMEQNIRQISNMEIQDHEQLREMDVYRLCRRYVAFELKERDGNAMSDN